MNVFIMDKEPRFHLINLNSVQQIKEVFSVQLLLFQHGKYYSNFHKKPPLFLVKHSSTHSSSYVPLFNRPFVLPSEKQEEKYPPHLQLMLQIHIFSITHDHHKERPPQREWEGVIARNNSPSMFLLLFFLQKVTIFFTLAEPLE